MRIIELDATKWKTYDDFYNAPLPSIGAPKWHGQNLNALVDSMIWGGINAVDPLTQSESWERRRCHKIFVITSKRALAKGRADYQKLRGGDVKVAIEIDS